MSIKDFEAIAEAINRAAFMAFENGKLEYDEVIELFQHLVSSGLAWQLQGSYGRTAKALIDSGEITT